MEVIRGVEGRDTVQGPNAAHVLHYRLYVALSGARFFAALLVGQADVDNLCMYVCMYVYVYEYVCVCVCVCVTVMRRSS